MSDDSKILLCWITSLTGIIGNEQVEKAAWSPLSMISEKNFKILCTDLKIKQIHTTTKAASLEQQHT